MSETNNKPDLSKVTEQEPHKTHPIVWWILGGLLFWFIASAAGETTEYDEYSDIARRNEAALIGLQQASDAKDAKCKAEPWRC